MRISKLDIIRKSRYSASTTALVFGLLMVEPHATLFVCQLGTQNCSECIRSQVSDAAAAASAEVSE